MRMRQATVGHAELADAFGEFAECWEWGVRDLVRAGDDIAQKLHDAGIAYEHDDVSAEQVFKRAIVAGFGASDADTEQAMTESWSEVGDQVGNTFTPDLSGSRRTRHWPTSRHLASRFSTT